MKSVSKTVVKIIESIFATSAMCLFLGYSSVNVFPIVLFIFIFYFINNVSISKSIISLIFSLIIALVFIIPGKYLVYYYDNYSGISLAIRLGVILIGGTIIFNYIISFLFDIFNKKKLNSNNKKSYLVFIISFLVICVSWLIFLLVEYPSPLQRDTFGSLMQIFKEIPYSNEGGNPLLHTLYLKFLYDISSMFFFNLSTKIFVMSLIQIVLHSLIHAYFCYYIYSKTNNYLITIISILFYSFISYSANYNIMLFKDSTFGLITELLVLSILRMNDNKSNINIVLYIITAILFCLLRNNGIYAYFFALAIFFFVQLFQGFNKSQIIIYIAPLLVSIVILKLFVPVLTNSLNSDFTSIKKTNNIINNYNLTQEDYYYLNEDNSEHQYSSIDKIIGNILIHVPVEMPVQEIGNVILHERPLTSEEKWIIEQRCPIEIIKEAYDINIVDPTIKAMKEHTKPTDAKIPGYRYVSLWFNLFKKYPKDYLEAYIYMTRCYTYPNKYSDCLMLGVADNKYGIKSNSLLSTDITNYIKNHAINQHENQLIGWLFSPGIVMIIILIMTAYGLRSKVNDMVFSGSCLIGLWFTIMIACPCADSFRYIYPAVESLPLILLSIFCLKNN